jgi:hypothetical protein
MERYQTFRHESVSGQAARLDRPSRSAVRSRLTLLVKLAQQPLFFWGSLWIAALMLTGLALGALLDPGFVNPQAASSPVVKSTQTTIPFENTTISSSDSSSDSSLDQTTDQITAPVAPSAPSTSLWSLGAIALSCAGASLLFAQYLNRSSSRSVKVKRFKSKPAIVSTTNSATQIQPLQLSQEVSNPVGSVVPSVDYQMPPALKSSTSRNEVRTRPVSPKALVSSSLSGNAIDLPDIAKAIVTVVPSDQSHPLDWDDGSLVNAMDIRKRHPLSSWL